MKEFKAYGGGGALLTDLYTLAEKKYISCLYSFSLGILFDTNVRKTRWIFWKHCCRINIIWKQSKLSQSVFCKSRLQPCLAQPGRWSMASYPQPCPDIHTLPYQLPALHDQTCPHVRDQSSSTCAFPSFNWPGYCEGLCCAILGAFFCAHACFINYLAQIPTNVSWDWRCWWLVMLRNSPGFWSGLK